MQRIDSILVNKFKEAIKTLYDNEIVESLIQIQKTKKEFEGDFTIVVFPILKISKKSPEVTASEIGDFLVKASKEIESYNVIKGFLNLSLSFSYWMDYFKDILSDTNYGIKKVSDHSKKIVIEYSSPNTNKPLHLGHIRNILLGWSTAKISEANGNVVNKVNLVNDRGIHICKSMLAWKELSNGKTPDTENIKGDHFVGDYYVAFDQKFKSQIQKLKDEGYTDEEAKTKADWIVKAREMLKQWEAGDPEVRELWKKMNSWVYKGFDETYNNLGVSFDKVYYESETYLSGKEQILKALENGKAKKKSDNTVYIDLTEDGLDEKVLLRSDGTALYMTQDIGTAILRYNDFKFDESIYVVGNEQDYHFKVMKIILKKLGYLWSDDIFHLSYGMVELPHGKMKSREGTVVDADDLIDEMIITAERKSSELGKLDEYTDKEKKEIFRKIALGALKYFILKVDAKKNMMFNPEESIDFNGNTGPFVQYTYVRIQSMLSKAAEKNISIDTFEINNNSLHDTELSLLNKFYDFPDIIREADEKKTPSFIANYVYDLAKEFNRFYHEIPPILKEKNKDHRNFRLALSEKTGLVIKTALDLLGIEVPERM